ncbi:unnamed protein product, partial [Owenia fusiformis]
RNIYVTTNVENLQPQGCCMTSSHLYNCNTPYTDCAILNKTNSVDILCASQKTPLSFEDTTTFLFSNLHTPKDDSRFGEQSPGLIIFFMKNIEILPKLNY